LQVAHMLAMHLRKCANNAISVKEGEHANNEI